MSEIYARIEQDLRTALKARSEVELGALRLLKSDIQYEMNRTGTKSLPDADIAVIIKRSVKKRNESIDQFMQAGRTEQADREEQEMAILKRYLPAEVSAEEINRELDELFSRIKPTGPKDMGKVMGQIMGKFKGQNIDGALVKELAQKRLQG